MSRIKKVYKDEVLAAIHETAFDLHRNGGIDKQTMKKFDKLCLTPIRLLTPPEIKAIRERERVSQGIFANYLGVSVSVISKWERGDKRPTGTALKLLCLVEKKGLQSVA